MIIWLNKPQSRNAINHFLKGATIIDVGYGDIYIDTERDEIVFLGVEHPYSFTLKNSDFTLDCEEEPYRLQVIAISCDCCNYGHATVIDNFGNEILCHYEYDKYDDNVRETIKQKLSKLKIKYDDITFHFL